MALDLSSLLNDNRVPAYRRKDDSGLPNDSAHQHNDDDDDDDEVGQLEIEVAARFQQMAGIYDSKPKDFAREMRETSGSTHCC